MEGIPSKSLLPQTETQALTVCKIFIYTSKRSGGVSEQGPPPHAPIPGQDPARGRVAGSKAGGGQGTGRGVALPRALLKRVVLVSADSPSCWACPVLLFFFLSCIYLYLFWHRKINRSYFGTSPSCESAPWRVNELAATPERGNKWGVPQLSSFLGAHPEPCRHRKGFGDASAGLKHPSGGGGRAEGFARVHLGARGRCPRRGGAVR